MGGDGQQLGAKSPAETRKQTLGVCNNRAHEVQDNIDNMAEEGMQCLQPLFNLLSLLIHTPAWSLSCSREHTRPPKMKEKCKSPALFFFFALSTLFSIEVIFFWEIVPL